VAGEPWLGAVPEWAARQPPLRSPTSSQRARQEAVDSYHHQQPVQELTGLMRSGTSNNGGWERGDVRLRLEAELLRTQQRHLTAECGHPYTHPTMIGYSHTSGACVCVCCCAFVRSDAGGWLI
jgi:hypothetical protein